MLRSDGKVESLWQDQITRLSYMNPQPGDQARHTDKYFLKTSEIVKHFGDCRVTYAVFMRRPVVFTPRLAIDWLQMMSESRGVKVDIEQCYAEGDWIGAGEPLMYITGEFAHLCDLETIFLQRLGPPCVAAYNSFSMCSDLKQASFIAMDARHCAGVGMAELMAYGCSVGSERARQMNGAVGFIGSSNDATAHYFGAEEGLGTMPHALIGYAGSTLRAAEMYHERFPNDQLTVLVDYFGQELTDSLVVCRRFEDLAHSGRLSLRLDTHGGRYIEGLDTATSYAILEDCAPQAIRTYRSETELKWLTGTGVSAAALFRLRRELDDAGFNEVKIVASSGFGPDKCKLMSSVSAPIDVVGTGSYIPQLWHETYATADIISYDGRSSVKVGREFLLR